MSLIFPGPELAPGHTSASEAAQQFFSGFQEPPQAPQQETLEPGEKGAGIRKGSKCHTRLKFDF